jgi:hypothetical protein
MAEEHHHEEKKEPEKPTEHKKKFHIKLTKKDIISIIALIVFLILVSIPVYVSKGECEISRPEYKCASIKNVMIENCVYWGSYNCNTNADVSLTQVEWYIKNLCDLQNNYHQTGLDCSNLKSACNKIVGNQTCPSI